VHWVLKKFKAIIFDYDQTIVNSLRRFYLTLNLCLSLYGAKTVDYEVFINLYSSDSLDILIPSHVDKQVFWTTFLKQFEKTPVSLSSLLPGALETLHELRRLGLKIGLVTGRLTSQEEFGKELKALGLYELFDAFATRLLAGEAFTPKTKMEAIRKLMMLLNVNPSQCVIVGDYHEDMIAAKELGSLPIGVLSGLMSPELLEKSGAKIVVGSIADVAPLIRKLIEE